MTGTQPSVKHQSLPTELYFSLVRQQLSDSGSAFVRVTGSSMQPLLHHLRDGVILVPPAKIRAGDIVLFDRRNGRYALHRVVRITGGDTFTMAGDNQAHLERSLPLAQVVGVVSAVVRDGKQIPCGRGWVRVYALAMAWFAVPRIIVRRVIGRLTGPFRNRKGSKGAGQ